jgi:hypothetical protein
MSPRYQFILKITKLPIDIRPMTLGSQMVSQCGQANFNATIYPLDKNEYRLLERAVVLKGSLIERWSRTLSHHKIGFLISGAILLKATIAIIKGLRRLIDCY